MARTIVGLGDEMAVNRFSDALAADVARDSYVQSKFVSTSDTTPIHKKTELENAPGHKISFQLSLQLVGRGVEGLSGEKLKDQEESLKFAYDEVYIDQKRHGVNAGTVMDQKRTLHDLRMTARDRLKDWWARWADEQFFMYGAGARGVNSDFIESLDYAGRANNPFTAPDADHIMYPGAVTSKAGLASTDKLTLATLDKLVARIENMGGGTQRVPKMQPVKINGGDHFVVIMNQNDKYNLRTNSTSNEWADLQKEANMRGKENPIFTGAMGMYNGLVLHSHQAGIRFSDYGAGNDVAASRVQVWGRQALCCAYGSPGGGRSFDWHEETDDRGNEVIIDTQMILGVKKTTYDVQGTDRDFGAYMIDCASAAA